MKKEERLQQQCDVCGRLLDKNISNFRKYSRKTNGLNFHTTCRDCEDRIKLNTEWKDGKLLCHICGEYKEPSEFTYAAAQVAMRQNKGAAYPAGLQYTYNAPSFPFSGRFSDVSWHEGIGHMVGDNNPQILKANPGINNRVDYESSTPLESQVYSSQPNERHADTWGFRGANVNMKDANGNYYIDPNRQLKGTDIQEMRTKGAKIPSGFNTLSDDEIAKLHNTFASNANNKRSNTMLIAKRGVQIKRRIIK